MYNIRIKNMQNTKTGTQLDYGLVDRNTLFVKPSTKVGSDVKSTIGAVPREEANVEAEGGETVVGDINNDGYLEHQTIVGKRHSKGGVPLNVAPGSFIFSDTKKMKIKDEEILSIFGLKPKTGGYTPAEIAKKYEITKFVAALKNPESDNYSKETAQIMMDSNLKKLGMLALVQESMKGFPDGIPAIAENVVANMQGGQEMQSPGQEAEEGVEHELMEGQEDEPQMQYGGTTYKGTSVKISTPKGDDVLTVKKQYKGFRGDEWVVFDKPITLANGDVVDELTTSDYKKLRETGSIDLGYKASPFNRHYTDVSNIGFFTNPIPLKQIAGAPTESNPYYTVKLSKMDSQSKYKKGQTFVKDNKTYEVLRPNVITRTGKKAIDVKLIDNPDRNLGSLLADIPQYTTMLQPDSSEQVVYKSTKKTPSAILNPGAAKKTEPVITPENKEVYDQTPKVLPAPKKIVQPKQETSSENTVYTDEEFAYGGIYQPGGTVDTNPNKKIVKWEISKVTGNRRPVYSDGTYGPVEKVGLEYDVADEDLRKEVLSKNYDFIELNPEFRYKKKKVGPQTKNTGYSVDPESGFLYKDIKPGAAGLKNYMDIHKEAIDAYPGGVEEWKKTMLANPGKENPAMRHLLIYENAAIGPLSNNRSYVDLNKKGAFVPGVENFNLPGIKKVNKPIPAKPVTPEKEIVPPTRPITPNANPNKGWWLQDRLNLLAAMTDKIGRFEPSMAHFDPIAYDYALLDPTRQLAASQEQQARYKDMLMNTTAGNVGAASMIGDFGESLSKNADIIANVENANVGIYNQMSAATAAANRNLEQLNETAKQKYIEDMAILNQNQLNDEMKKKYRQLAAFNTGHTNWTKKKWMENVLFPQYNVDPISGDVNFTEARPMMNDDGTFAYSPYAPAYNSAANTGVIDTDSVYNAYIKEGYGHQEALDLTKLKAGQYQNKRSRANNDYTYGYDPEALMGGII